MDECYCRLHRRLNARFLRAVCSRQTVTVTALSEKAGGGTACKKDVAQRGQAILMVPGALLEEITSLWDL